MRWIGRFFLVIALIFLALDITDPIAAPPTTGTAATGGTATDGTATGGTTGSTTGGETTTDGGTTAGATTGGATTDGGDTATTGGTTGGDAAATEPAATASSGPNRVMLHTLGERWHQYHPSSALQVSPAVSRHVSPWLDDNIVQPLMLQPAFLIFFALWLIFSFFSWLIGRSRSRYDDEDDW